MIVDRADGAALERERRQYRLAARHALRRIPAAAGYAG